jgi:microcystin-dependent protein
MSNPYVGEIRMFAGNFAPSGWALCQGQLLPISQYDVLFNLIGTTYGGDGTSNFALPDLQGRFPAHQGAPAITGGTPVILGERLGVESVTLVTAQLPVHTHTAQGSSSATTRSPSGAFWGTGSANAYSSAEPSARLAPKAVATTGASQPHNNIPPYLVINFIISFFGTYPSQS